MLHSYSFHLCIILKNLKFSPFLVQTCAKFVQRLFSCTWVCGHSGRIHQRVNHSKVKHKKNSTRNSKKAQKKDTQKNDTQENI